MQPVEPWIWVYDDAARHRLRTCSLATPDTRPCAYKTCEAFNSWTNTSKVKMLSIRLTLYRLE